MNINYELARVYGNYKLWAAKDSWGAVWYNLTQGCERPSFTGGYYNPDVPLLLKGIRP